MTNRQSMLKRLFQFFNLPPALAIMMGFIFFTRISCIWLMGAMPQDGYYNFYAEHLALSYFDHPPFIAYLLKFFTKIFGINVFALKIADTLVTFLSAFLFYRLSQMFLIEHQAKNALLLFFSTLMYSILSLVSTPDVPLILFWIVSLLFLYNAVFLDKKTSWFLSGAAIGLAFDSKYSAIFLLAGLFIFLILCKPYRRFLMSYRIVSLLVSFLLVASPVIIWNIQNKFISFKFQSFDRLNNAIGIRFSITDFLGVVGHQCGIILPVAFFALTFFLFKALKNRRLRFENVAPQKLFLMSFFLPLFIGFLLLSPFYWIKLNWMMPAYISGLIWLAIYIPQKWVRWQIILSFIVHSLFAAEVYFYIIPIKSEDTWFGWEQLAVQVKKLQNDLPNTFIFSAKTYKTSAMLDFYLQEPVYGSNIIGEQALQFSLVYNDLRGLAGKDALFILCDPGFVTIEKAEGFPNGIETYFSTITQLQPILISNYHKPVRKFLVYYCHNYQPRQFY